MSKTSKLQLSAVAALASLALLIPAASAQAGGYATVPFCGNYNPNTGSYTPKTLNPGDVCTFYPVAVAGMSVTWKMTKAGSGSICVGVMSSPPGWPKGKWLTNTGNPRTGYTLGCNPPNGYYGGGGGYTYWKAENGFGAVYGQPVMVNFSTATIKTDPLSGALGYWY
jgi:hypothetical protein